MTYEKKPVDFWVPFFLKTNLEENIYEHILHVGQAALVHYVINHDIMTDEAEQHRNIET